MFKLLRVRFGIETRNGEPDSHHDQYNIKLVSEKNAFLVLMSPHPQPTGAMFCCMITKITRKTTPESDFLAHIISSDRVVSTSIVVLDVKQRICLHW